ncbi:KTSC domain-containing protein [Leptospira yasudae]|uniref:KTSC domain-containing protein n=1 Tax=Leptospira yasudae TaxID=2202201 RepID=A0ABX9M8I2_9LEPT|nr:KTSC domain-containing protein [Leptospira yasudae]MBW0432671.1 KTSC domain-containing protein [Leptospira yasudae]RHX81467.1 KTSC domain-containing protein [Leptospira yasudae]TGN01340.1 KTSC domain-containing protein [Leptospira yasudae]
MLETHYISSPEIESIGYDFETCDLLIRFRSGEEKRYADVSKETYVSLMQSGSKMKFVETLGEPLS